MGSDIEFVTALDCFRALVEGKALRKKTWEPGHFIKFSSGWLLEYSGWESIGGYLVHFKWPKDWATARLA